jgi:beta-galactosidase
MSQGTRTRPAAFTGPLLYGGDHNPEQWDAATLAEDLRLLRGAHVNTLTLNVFSWSLLQRDEDTYDFSGLDRIIEQVSAAGMSIDLATSTGAVPPWLARAHPEICRVDVQGRRHLHGVRENACLSSPIYQELAPRLAGTLAARYAGLENLVLWHVSNEYWGRCYCDLCAGSFRGWLLSRYGSLDAINEAWTADFWGHRYHDLAEINPPSEISDLQEGSGVVALPGLGLDHRRFSSDLARDAFRAEKAAIRAHDPHTPVMTNLMMPFQDYDYASWAPDLDVITWDSYPRRDDPPSHTGMHHDLMRGLKGGDPFLLLEQTPSRQDITHAAKRPGQMRAQSWQAVAHGADGVMFFQMRQSAGGGEQFHGAVIGPQGDGRVEDTRVHRAVTELGAELARIGERIRGSRVQADVALLWDWEAWWAWDGICGKNPHADYLDEARHWHAELVRRGIGVDVLSPSAALDGYSLVIAPMLFLTRDEDADGIARAVRGGTRLVLTALSGVLDREGRVRQGPAPVPFRELVGVWDEEMYNLDPADRLPLVFPADGDPAPGAAAADVDPLAAGSASGDAPRGRWTAQYLRPDADTEVLARFGTGPDAEYVPGEPAVTRHPYGAGQALYVGTLPDDAALARILERALDGLGIEQHELPGGAETTLRIAADGTRFRFYLNGTREARTVPLVAPGTELLTGERADGRAGSGEQTAAAAGTGASIDLEPYGVRIVEEDTASL